MGSSTPPIDALSIGLVEIPLTGMRNGRRIL